MEGVDEEILKDTAPHKVVLLIAILSLYKWFLPALRLKEGIREELYRM